MSPTQGPAGVVWLGYDLDAPALGPSQYATPTGSFKQTMVWRFVASEAGRYRIDLALSRLISRTPLPAGKVLNVEFQVYRGDIDFNIVTSNTLQDDEEETGAVFTYDPAHDYWITATPYIWDTVAESEVTTAAWLVPRLSPIAIDETVQLPERDCIVAFADNTVVPLGDADVVLGTPLATGNDVRGNMTDYLNGWFEGGMTFQEPFGLPEGIVGIYGAAWAVEWLVARRQSAGGFYWYDDDFQSTYSGDPTGPPPDLSPGPEFSNTWPDGITLCGFDMVWNGAALLPTSAETRTFGCGFSFRHETIASWPGPLGDGVPLSAYDTSDERLANLSKYLTTEGVPDSINFEVVDVDADLLEMHFQADEAPSSWWDRNGNTPAAIKDVTVAWLTSLPPHEVLDWGIYLDDAGQGAMSNVASPENWNDPTVEVLTVATAGAGGGWVPVDWEARKAYQDGVDVEFPTAEPPGYRFYAFPTELWSTSVPDETLGSNTGGTRGHYNNDPRFALKLRVRPVPFTAQFPPVLEPADPDFPEIDGTPGPSRAVFWPQ